MNAIPKLVCCSVLIWLWPTSPSVAADMLIGKPFQDALNKKVGATWAGVTLRDALRELSNETRVAILLDRRIDPSQEVNLALPLAPLKDNIAAAAKSVGAGSVVVGNLIYIGPLHAAQQLPTLIDRRNAELSKLVAAPLANVDKTAKKVPAQTAASPWKARLTTLKQLHTFSWQDLDRPRNVLQQVAEKAQIEIDNLDQCPHDLWAVSLLPQVNIIEALSLVLIQFDGTFAYLPNRTAIRVFPMADDVPAVPMPMPNPMPTETKSDKKSTAKPAIPLSKRNYSKVSFPGISVRELITHLEKSGVKLDYDFKQLADAGIPLGQKIRFEAEQISAEKLLRDLFEPVGIEVTIVAETAKLRPKK